MNKNNLVEKYLVRFDRNFHVGDRVQFKSWDDMVEEYGTYNTNYEEGISCKFHFNQRMKYLCGTLATIKKICEDDRVYFTHYSSPVSAKENDIWSYSTDMINKTRR